MTKFVIDEWQINLIECHDDRGSRKRFNHVYAFVKNNQRMTPLDLKDLKETICDILDAKGVNFGILMFMHGTYVFTEIPVDLNALMIKLADGINFNGEVTSGFGNLSQVNSTLER